MVAREELVCCYDGCHPEERTSDEGSAFALFMQLAHQDQSRSFTSFRMTVEMKSLSLRDNGSLKLILRTSASAGPLCGKRRRRPLRIFLSAARRCGRARRILPDFRRTDRAP